MTDDVFGFAVVFAREGSERCESEAGLVLMTHLYYCGKCIDLNW